MPTFDVQGIEIRAPRARVFEFLRRPGNLPQWTRAFKAADFDPGHGRLMKEWVAVSGAEESWVDLAKEARRFVRKAG